MIQNPIYNDTTDVCRTVAGLSIDLNLALREGVVKDTGVEPEFNGIDDPRNIRGRVDNSFDAIDERNRLLARDKAAAVKKAAEKAAAASKEGGNNGSE